MTGKVYTVDEIKLIVVPILAGFGAKKISLFGSYAKGKAKEKSDVDLIVLLPDKFNPVDYFKVEQRLRDVLGKRVDILEYRCVADHIRDYIMERSIVLYDEEQDNYERNSCGN